MPCLNEADTLATCIEKAKKSLEKFLSLTRLGGQYLIVARPLYLEITLSIHVAWSLTNDARM